MPGSVVAVSATEVMPLSLCRAFRHERDYPIWENEFPNGESIRRKRASSSRKSWRLAKALTATQLADLRDFYEARSGSLEPFFFYDGTDTATAWAYDATGVATTGRYTVRFNDAKWGQDVTLPRAGVDITLIEVS